MAQWLCNRSCAILRDLTMPRLARFRCQGGPEHMSNSRTKVVASTL